MLKHYSSQILFAKMLLIIFAIVFLQIFSIFFGIYDDRLYFTILNMRVMIHDT